MGCNSHCREGKETTESSCEDLAKTVIQELVVFPQVNAAGDACIQMD